MDEPCEPIQLDGGEIVGCGACSDCLQQEYDEIERSVELGEVDEIGALAMYASMGVY